MPLPSDPEERRRVLGGRAAHNARQKRVAFARRLKLLQYTSKLDRPLKRGEIKQLAKSLGVHRSTIWRDFRFLEGSGLCPHCGQKLAWLVDKFTL